MASLLSITKYLNKYLNIRSIEDSSRNGMQVRSNNTISKIGLAVDARLTTFEKAYRQKCDLIIVHHGLFWKGKKDDLGLVQARVEYLKKHGISLYASHLPLDLHAEVGNNIELARMIKLEKIQPFGEYHGMTIGYKGRLAKATTINDIARQLDKNLGGKSQTHSFGNKKITTCGIVSGGGASALAESVGLDCFITGEAPHHSYIDAQELKINLIVGGHYHTETVGVIALGKHIENKFNIPCIFIEDPIQ